MLVHSVCKDNQIKINKGQVKRPNHQDIILNTQNHKIKQYLRELAEPKEKPRVIIIKILE